MKIENTSDYFIHESSEIDENVSVGLAQKYGIFLIFCLTQG